MLIKVGVLFRIGMLLIELFFLLSISREYVVSFRAVYHLHRNHIATLYEMREKIRYHLRFWPF